MQRRDNVIGTKTYSIILPPVRQAMPLCTRTAVLLGPLMGGLVGSTLSRFTEAVSGVDPDAADKLLMDAVNAGHLCVNNQPISTVTDFEKHFDENRADVFPVLVWCLWEIVKDFFPNLAAFGQLVTGTKAQQSKSPTNG